MAQLMVTSVIPKKVLDTGPPRHGREGKAGKVWSLPRFWVPIGSYKKQPDKKCWGRILDLAWLKFAVAAL